MGNNWVLFIATNVAIGILSFILGYLVKQARAAARAQSVEAKAERLLAEAQNKHKEIELGARDAALKITDEAEKEAKQLRAELRTEEQRLHRRREGIEQKADGLDNRERQIEASHKQLERERAKIGELQQEQRDELERIAGLNTEEAKALLLKEVEADTRQAMARMIREVEAEAKDEADRRAREIVTLSIQRIASDQVAEVTISAVPLPNDEMKGRIIGRGGRNIRAIEQATGVDLIVDDTPEAIIISSFDPVRREVARVALAKLILDGRIHPARIENVVEKAQQQVDQIIREEGEKTVYELGVHGLHPELIKLLGRLRYRTSYGQNVLQHSIEAAHLAAIMASELKANVKMAKLAGLLHDIGKGVDHEVEGPHALIGADLAKKYGEASAVIHGIAAHHEEIAPESTLAVLVQAADTLSGARPGARQEMLESYVKRLEDLERIALSFNGVSKSFAIQAGREIRIMVEGKIVDDDQAFLLCKDIAKKIEKELTYPGQVKVTVIRETRAVVYAK